MGEVKQVGRFLVEAVEGFVPKTKKEIKQREEWSRMWEGREKAVLKLLQTGPKSAQTLDKGAGVKPPTGFELRKRMRIRGLIRQGRGRGIWERGRQDEPKKQPPPRAKEGRYTKLVSCLEVLESYEKLKGLEKAFGEKDAWLRIDEVEGISISPLRLEAPEAVHLPGPFVGALLKGFMRALLKEITGTGLKEAKDLHAKILSLGGAKKKK